MHSTSRNGEARGDGASLSWRSADGKPSCEDVPSQSKLRTMGSQWTMVLENCPGATATSQRSMSEVDRSLLRGDPSGSARLAAADERISRALAEAVGRHVTKEPGERGILKRASAVRRPESEPQKKIALDTEQELPPHAPVSYGGSSASGAQASIATSIDQNTGAGDVTREVGDRTYAGCDWSKQQR